MEYDGPVDYWVSPPRERYQDIIGFRIPLAKVDFQVGDRVRFQYRDDVQIVRVLSIEAESQSAWAYVRIERDVAGSLGTDPAAGRVGGEQR